MQLADDALSEGRVRGAASAAPPSLHGYPASRHKLMARPYAAVVVARCEATDAAEAAAALAAAELAAAGVALGALGLRRRRRRRPPRTWPNPPPTDRSACIALAANCDQLFNQ